MRKTQHSIDRRSAWHPSRRGETVEARGDRSLAGVLGRLATIACLLAAAIVPVGCGEPAARTAASVTIYTSADDAIAREVLAACAEATGVELVPVFDTEATKTSGLERRIRDERARPRADIFWSSEGFSTVRLAAEGLVDALPDAVRDAWPSRHIDPDGRWFAFAARGRVVVSRADAPPPPSTWGGFGAPGLATGSRAAVAIADPRFGTTRAHLAALDDAWRRARADASPTEVAESSSLPVSLDAWLAGLRGNGVLVLPGGNAATVEAVRTGEAAYGFTDTDDALAAIARGAELAMWLPRTLPDGIDGGGTMIVPNTIAIVRGGPASREAVDRVVAWFASGAAEDLLCRSASRNLPLVAESACDPGFIEPDPLAFDLAAASMAADALAVRAKEILEGGVADDRGSVRGTSEGVGRDAGLEIGLAVGRESGGGGGSRDDEDARRSDARGGRPDSPDHATTRLTRSMRRFPSRRAA